MNIHQSKSKKQTTLMILIPVINIIYAVFISFYAFFELIIYLRVVANMHSLMMILIYLLFMAVPIIINSVLYRVFYKKHYPEKAPYLLLVNLLIALTPYLFFLEEYLFP